MTRTPPATSADRRPETPSAPGGDLAAAPATSAVSVRGLRRVYGTGARAFEAVRGLDLEVGTGTITALLGTNGAGKTSALEVVEGLSPAAGGQVRVLGLDPVRDRAEVRRRTAVLLQDSGFSGDLTVVETLAMWAGTLDAPRPLEEALAMLDLADRADVRVRALSGGERRRLDLACTLLGRPELVLLDEPSTGLDPESRHRVWDLLRGLREDGVTVLLTTHYLDEAEALADRLAIMHRGRLVRSGTIAEITAGSRSRIAFTTPAGVTDLPPLGGAAVTVEGASTVISTEDSQSTLTALLCWAEAASVRLDRLEVAHGSLESVFLAIAADRDPDESPADPTSPTEENR